MPPGAICYTLPSLVDYPTAIASSNCSFSLYEPSYLNQGQETSSRTRSPAPLLDCLRDNHHRLLKGRRHHPLRLQSHGSCRLVKRIGPHHPQELLAHASGNRHQGCCHRWHERHCPLPRSGLKIKSESAKDVFTIKLVARHWKGCERVDLPAEKSSNEGNLSAISLVVVKERVIQMELGMALYGDCWLRLMFGKVNQSCGSKADRQAP